ncbi:MAG: ABC transporter ATP-binding protein [Anaerolineales bacterium]|nr:MAG: ABC transporter ATP-binding protein [Anaerolineales bacterium]
MRILTVEQLCKNFGGLKAICNLDFHVDEGEILGIIGPNGSGKTTVLNLITGFLKPNSGKITFRGEDITGQPRYKINQKGIARTFQLCKPFLDFTAQQNVMVGRMYGQDPCANMKTAANESDEILDRVGLLNKSCILVKDLRVMERKRLELARALATKPTLLLLDELMAGLNLAEADEVCQLISAIRESNITIIMVEHIVKAVTCISNRILVLNMGELIAQGPPEEVVNQPNVIEVYLGKAHA